MHKSIPNGKNFTDLDLKERLTNLFSKYVSDEMLWKLSTLDSSNSIENMNQLVARKAPKALHFSESESLDFRVSAAVLQKNEGHAYMCKVNEHYSLSPGKYTHDRFTGLEKKRQRRRLEQETAQYKIRRLHLKEEKRQGQELHANLEGTTYGVDPLTPPEPDNLVDVPEPVLNPGPPSIGTGNNAIVVFDLETTGFGMGSDIIQIAAKEIRTGNLFSRYVYPASGVIPNNIAKLTEIMFCNQQMTHHGKPVPGCTATEACEAFIRFIEQFSPVVLVAHNVLFDSKILLNSFHRCSIDYHSIINGFGDTLKLFRSELPERKQNCLGYKQADLVNDILSRKYNAHSADEDVSTLCDLLETVQNYGHKLPFHSKKSIESRLFLFIQLYVISWY